MQAAGYIASLFIGIALGLIGGGGSILTVPVLVYLFGINPVLSTSYSLFIVGVTSLLGAANNYRNKLVRVKIALLFGLSSVTTVFIIRKYIIPIIPERICTIGTFYITHSGLTMVLFAALMMVSGRAMIQNKNRSGKAITENKKANRALLLWYGVAVGLATGLLGAGGGFLLIPTLVLFMKLPMKEAVGTSLFIIALNSLIGFAGDAGHFTIDWLFLGKITFAAAAGVFTGGLIGKKIDGAKLKKAFGWFVLAMGIFILIKETFFMP